MVTIGIVAEAIFSASDSAFYELSTQFDNARFEVERPVVADDHEGLLQALNADPGLSNSSSPVGGRSRCVRSPNGQ